MGSSRSGARSTTGRSTGRRMARPRWMRGPAAGGRRPPREGFSRPLAVRAPKGRWVHNRYTRRAGSVSDRSVAHGNRPLPVRAPGSAHAPGLPRIAPVSVDTAPPVHYLRRIDRHPEPPP